MNRAFLKKGNSQPIGDEIMVINNDSLNDINKKPKKSKFYKEKEKGNETNDVNKIKKKK